MSDPVFQRYAVYYTPPAGGWADWATSWLGWDLVRGATLPHPKAGFDVRAVTTTPRRYGLHATIKPPFRLAQGMERAGLEAACVAFAQSAAPVRLDGLEVARLGRFLALRPVGDDTALSALAAATVEALDAFRAPASEAELRRRRSARLSPAQDANLTRWGYPYVMGEFRFHITLTGRLETALLDQVLDHLGTHLTPLLPNPFDIAELALVGEDEAEQFHLIRRYRLGASTDA